MSFLENLNQMPGDLRSLHQTRSDWERTLSNFRAHRNVWKASLLVGEENEQESDIAEACWQQLRKIRQKIVRLHKDSNFSEAENSAFVLPYDEYREAVEVGEGPPAPARMPDDIKKLLALSLESEEQ